MDTGPQAIGDGPELAQVRRQARAVYVKAFVSAVIFTAVAMLIP